MKKFTLITLALSLFTLSLAQGNYQERRGNMRELQLKVVRLSVTNSLPREDRARAKALIDRMQVLKEQAIHLRFETLEAQLTALEAGEVSLVARELGHVDKVSQICKLRI